MPDSRSVILRAAEAGKGSRTFVQSIAGGDPRVAVPEDIRATIFSHDSRGLVGVDAAGVWRLYPIDGARAPVELRGVAAGDEPVGWTSDGRDLLVATTTVPARLERVDVATGSRRVVRELRPPGLDGIQINVNTATADGEQFAYAGLRTSRTLYLVK